MSVNNNKYHISIRILHWLMAFLILGMIGIGWYMAGLPKESPLMGNLIGIHKSFGVLVLLLFFVRLVARMITKAPELPDSLGSAQKFLAKSGHKILYVLIAIVPFSGYAMSNLFGYGVSLFGIPMPRIFAENKENAVIAHEAHEILPYILLGFIAVHFLAVIKHRYFDKPGNDVLPRML